MKKEKFLAYTATSIGIVFVLAIFVSDKRISAHPALVIYYIIPIALATWFAGPLAGICIVSLSILCWFSGGIFESRSLFGSHAFFYLHIALRIFLLFSVVYVLNRLKIALKHEKELSERKSSFVAKVSHEFKNPLGIIKEAMAIILDGVAGEVSPRQKELLEIGKKNTERLIRLVSNLLDVSKIEAGKMEMHFEEVDITLLMYNILEDRQKDISRKQQVLEVNIAKDVGCLWADRDKIEQVIINLLDNAIKYTPVRGRIAVKIQGNGSEIRFELSDTGAGIAEKDMAKLFDAFERLSADKHEGTGLGLSIVKDIIELHKGKIWVESKVGKGSTFIFTLPRDFAHK